uniref:Uncharacterized protein n=1 Tax=Chromera velia CCMP2878 TaxID=1169474 RepID=A0A0G4HMR7_9ALVE|eukprot:Cvel_7521.t1-p1 / transcript=Cvel_7521.t1 / gene=Cvel_7521 / organism=Chromera_velia_CCMP2878 / gene_product=hypothetical protein / transcript_product=hypothetical protein / location=Cvel_scaffold395:30163-31666(+) / protein_length=424 / sequence_SO=supercontig / SO=protein_coding / is_pseudo=false
MGALGMTHALFGLIAIFVLWVEFCRLLFTGFSADTSSRSLFQSPEEGRLSRHQIVALIWIVSAVLCTLTALPMPFQGFIFSTPRIGDPASEQRSYNWGRAVAGLQYPYLAIRAVLLPGGAPLLRLLDAAVALLMLRPHYRIAQVYPHTLGAYWPEWMIIAQMALYGEGSALVSDVGSRVILYYNGVLWAKMIFDGFLGYTLYVKGFHSIRRVRREVTIASSTDVTMFLVLFIRAGLERGVGGVGGIAPAFALQAIFRAVNLGMFPLNIYRTGSWVQAVHSSLWVLWGLYLGPQGREALFWSVAAWVFFFVVAHSKGDAVVVTKVVNAVRRVLLCVLPEEGVKVERQIEKEAEALVVEIMPVENENTEHVNDPEKESTRWDSDERSSDDEKKIERRRQAKRAKEEIRIKMRSHSVRPPRVRGCCP